MHSDIYRYEFPAAIPMDEVESSIVLALLAAEALHGECQVQLLAPHYLDSAQRVCIVDASSRAGADFNRVFLNFLRREFGTTGFQVRTVRDASAATAA